MVSIPFKNRIQFSTTNIPSHSLTLFLRQLLILTIILFVNTPLMELLGRYDNLLIKFMYPDLKVCHDLYAPFYY